MLLELFGWIPNNKGDYVFVNADASDDVHQREVVANEFRQSYDELKKTKDNGIEQVKEAFDVGKRPFVSQHRSDVFSFFS